MYILHLTDSARVKFGSYSEATFYDRLGESETRFHASGFYDLIIDSSNRMIGIRVNLLCKELTDLFTSKKYTNVVLETVKYSKFFRSKFVVLAYIFSSEVVSSADFSITHTSENCTFYLSENGLWDLYLLDLAPANLNFIT